jgi:hypothetical protein
MLAASTSADASALPKGFLLLSAIRLYRSPGTTFCPCQEQENKTSKQEFVFDIHNFQHLKKKIVL